MCCLPDHGPGSPIGMLIARIANFVHATSGGLRTALRELGRGYLEAGHEAVLIVPGAVASDEQTDYGRVITLPGPMVPGLGGYRVLLNRIAVGGLLRRLERIGSRCTTGRRCAGPVPGRGGPGSRR